MKKIMALILALTMTIVFVGCGKKSESETSESVTFDITPEDLERMLRESGNSKVKGTLEVADLIGEFKCKYTNICNDDVRFAYGNTALQFIGTAERDSHKIKELIIYGGLCSVASIYLDDYSSSKSKGMVNSEIEVYALILSNIFDINQEEGEKLINNGDATTKLKGKEYHIITKNMMMISLHL